MTSAHPIGRRILRDLCVSSWRSLRSKLLPLLLFVFTLPVHAHIGSPDTFLQTQIGSYAVLLAAHPPATFPGSLELDLRFNPADKLTSATAALDDARPTPIQLILDGTASTTLWTSTPAAHTLHLTVQGSHGPATLTLTLPPASRSTEPKRNGHTPALVLAMAFVVIVAVVFLRIVHLILPPENPLRRYRHEVFGTATTLAILASITLTLVHPRPLPQTVLSATLTNSHLDLTLTNPQETFADLAPDHNKLLHLFLIREPAKDVLLHLHPVQTTPGHFTTSLPAMPPGTYTLFADLYHANGRNETPTLTVTLPAQSHPAATDPDDTSAVLPPLTLTQQQGASSSPGSREPTTLHTAQLPDNYILTLRTPNQLIPLHPILLDVTLLDPTGNPPPDMAPYLGMSAHAIVLKADNTVFAHIHPGSTLPMFGSMSMNTHTTNSATIPYGFPSAGLYRIFVQMKHGIRVETAAFDLNVQ